MVDRLRRPSQYDSMLEELRESGVFEKLTNILVFAACLGFKRSNRKPFNQSGEPIRLAQFNEHYDEAVMNALAILEKDGDAMMLAKENEEEKIKIFEEYACGGLEILSREIAEPKLEWEKALIDIILDEADQTDALTNLTEELSDIASL